MELFRLLGTIAIDNAGARKEIDETTATAEKAESKIGKAFDGIGKAASAMAKVGAVAVTAAAAGIVAITKQAVDSYAEYEQLVGGVETLFKDSQDKVLEYANNAYKTAGLSANEYMETVTSFSASLLQSLDGDTDAAAEKANLAITDMSDNANKMGTSMEMIQNAYQGFAKQNYTMLDNLKLGYGGTKEEMERLLADATALSGVEYDIESYGDIVDAIHVIQDNLGITGTTAKEASTTIQGSFSAMKSAWANLLTGMSDSTQDFDALLSNMVDSAITFADNIVPRVLETLPRAVQGIGQLITSLMPYISQTIQELLPVLIEGAVLITQALIEALPDIVQALDAVIPMLVDAIISMLPLLIEVGIQIIITLMTAIFDNLPMLISKMPELVMTIARAILDNAPKLLIAAAGLVASLLSGFIDTLGKKIGEVKDVTAKRFAEVAEAIYKPIKSAYDKVVGVVDGIKDKFQQAGEFIAGLLGMENTAGEKSTKITGSKGSTTAATKGAKVDKHAAGGVLTAPTIFGYTPSSNTYHLGGEAGAEAIAPISVLQNYVEASVAKVMGDQSALLQGILNAILQQGGTGNSQTMTAYVQLDGKTVAKSVFKPLKALEKQHGTSLITT